VPWEFSEGILPDYILGQYFNGVCSNFFVIMAKDLNPTILIDSGQTCVAMFLSVRYHTLNPNYIHDR
jgi:hypothetical protein